MKAVRNYEQAPAPERESSIINPMSRDACFRTTD
jgi:hypothetical protein